MGRVERAKRSRKTLQWFQQHYGFKPPYHVVLAADFIKVCVAKNKRIDVLLRSLLGEDLIIETTRCTINALPYPEDTRGRPGAQSSEETELALKLARVARSFSLTFQCRHQHLDANGVPKYSSADCLSKITENTQNKIIVATSDYALWKVLRKRRTVPLVTTNEFAQLSLTAPKQPKLLKDAPSRAAAHFEPVVQEKIAVKAAVREERELRRETLKRQRTVQSKDMPIYHIRRGRKPVNPEKEERRRQRALAAAAALEAQSEAAALAQTAALLTDPGQPASATAPKKPRQRVRKGQRKRAAIQRAQQEQLGEGQESAPRLTAE